MEKRVVFAFLVLAICLGFDDCGRVVGNTEVISAIGQVSVLPINRSREPSAHRSQQAIRWQRE